MEEDVIPEPVRSALLRVRPIKSHIFDETDLAVFHSISTYLVLFLMNPTATAQHLSGLLKARIQKARYKCV